VQEAAFRDIFVRYSALPQITRFVMGVTWRDMSDAQKRRFEAAFIEYVGRVYGRLLSEYEGQTIEVRSSRDFGDRGVLVVSVGRGPRVDGSEVEWLVSDRAGDGPKLVDITAEGVSLLQTQRQEFGAMLERRNGDVDQFIDDLSTES
jgi:phospholipid transport system substrate-binding protein